MNFRRFLRVNESILLTEKKKDNATIYTSKKKHFRIVFIYVFMYTIDKTYK
jgi:hypothetical protein